MTALETSAFPDMPSGHVAIIGRIGKLAVPLMVGSLAAAGLQVVKAAILSHHGADAALYTLSLVQPAFILMLAFLESLAITNQVFSSKSVGNWARGDVMRATRVYSIIGLLLTAVLAAGFYSSAPLVGKVWPEGGAVMPDMALFVLSLAPYLLFELRNGALRGQGRTALALIPFAVLILGDVTATWIAVTRFDLGFTGVMIGNAAGPLMALPLASLLLRREIAGAKRGADSDFRKHVIGLTIGVAGPVFVSMFAGSASAAVIFPALAAVGQDTASGFLVIVRIRILFIIPAIAVGSAIAILINQMPERARASEKRGILAVGVVAVLAIYALATLGVYVMRDQIVDFVVPAQNVALHDTTTNMMVVLIATFFLVAAFTMIQVILEHLGLGVKVLLVTIVTEVSTIGLIFAVQARGYGLDGLLHLMNGVAVMSFVIIGAVFLSFLHKMGKAEGTDAV